MRRCQTPVDPSRRHPPFQTPAELWVRHRRAVGSGGGAWYGSWTEMGLPDVLVQFSWTSSRRRWSGDLEGRMDYVGRSRGKRRRRGDRARGGDRERREARRENCGGAIVRGHRGEAAKGPAFFSWRVAPGLAGGVGPLGRARLSRRIILFSAPCPLVYRYTNERGESRAKRGRREEGDGRREEVGRCAMSESACLPAHTSP
jgi:hypothetical protein